MTPEELLAKAADYMAQRGKATGVYEDEDTREVCAYGAMTLAATDGRRTDYASWACCADTDILDLFAQAAGLLARSIEPGTEDLFNVITHLNDSPNVTAEDMILTLKKAAAGGA